MTAHVIAVGFLGRSFTQQWIAELEYRRFRKKLLQLLKDEEVQNQLARIAEKIQFKKPKVELNWEKNPALQETAENLGIFDD
jgi:hypothetical protein